MQKIYAMNDKDFFKLLQTFVFEVYPIAKDALDKRVYFPPTYDKYPRVRFDDNKVPSLDFYEDKPKDISAVFTSYSGKPDINLEDYNSYKECIVYITEHKYFEKVIFYYRPEKDDADLFRVKSFLIDIIERYYLLNADCTPNEELLEGIYKPLEYPAFNSKLYIDISIPLLNVSFDFEEYKINDSCCIRRISAEQHKSRIYIRSDNVSNSIISASTHEFVLINWHVDTDKGGAPIYFSSHRENYYPINIFDNFIVALKICVDINSGYSQMLIYPKDWALLYNMDLQEIIGTTIRKYPSSFEKYNAIHHPSLLDGERVKEVGQIFTLLQSCDQNKIKIACKRLRYSFMRDDEEDSILDLIIAIEVLLTDNEKGEITHKLSMRLAKLISMYDSDNNPNIALTEIKKAYAYRSKIVHGSHQKEMNTSQKLSEEDDLPIYSEHTLNAGKYLRLLIRILLENPLYLVTKEIDKKMIE